MILGNDSTKTKILLAAGPIFAEKGLRRTTVREICAAAEVNLASVNYYFHDKESLYLETVHYARAKQNTRFPFPDWESHTSPEHRLRGFVTTLLQRITVLQEAPWQVRLMMNEVLNPTDACRTLVQEYFQPVFERLLTIVDELAVGKLPSDVRTKLGFAIVAQCLFYRYSNNVALMLIKPSDQVHFNMEALAAHISDFCIVAIKRGHWENDASQTASGFTR